MAGRRPKPTALHRLEGTLNVTKHRDRALEPLAFGDLRATPSGLTPEQRSLWRYVMAHAPKHVLRKIDRNVLLLWIVTQTRHNEAQRLLDRELNAVNWAKSPLHRILNNTTALLVRLVAELGFSPAARPRIRIDPPSTPDDDDDDDPWRQLHLIPGGRD